MFEVEISVLKNKIENLKEKQKEDRDENEKKFTSLNNKIDNNFKDITEKMEKNQKEIIETLKKQSSDIHEINTTKHFSKGFIKAILITASVVAFLITVAIKFIKIT